MGLNEAMNRRKSGQQHVVPIAAPDGFMIVADSPPPVVAEQPDTLRKLRPGEVGTHAEPVYPDVPYDIETLRTLVTRVRNGSDFMLAHLSDEQGIAQVGYFIDLMEATSCMFVAHMSNHILNPED